MARSDWAALLTEPAAEYLAYSELQRFGLTAYLPQLRKRHQTRAGAYVLRHFPLFPRYLLIPYRDAYDPSVRLARGIARHRCVLADKSGRPWRAPDKVIAAVRTAETGNLYDQILHKGDAVTLAYGVMATVRSVMASAPAASGMIELLFPLFGGVRGTVEATQVIHATA